MCLVRQVYLFKLRNTTHRMQFLHIRLHISCICMTISAPFFFPLIIAVKIVFRLKIILSIEACGLFFFFFFKAGLNIPLNTFALVLL